MQTDNYMEMGTSELVRTVKFIEADMDYVPPPPLMTVYLNLYPNGKLSEHNFMSVEHAIEENHRLPQSERNRIKVVKFVEVDDSQEIIREGIRKWAEWDRGNK